MNRFLSALKLDVTVQVRNKLYAIGISVAILVAAGLYWLASADQLHAVVPALMLVVIGGTTLLYVGALIVFEKDEGTLNAVIVSPLRTSEYLWSKIATLTALATLESAIMVGGALVSLSGSDRSEWPNIPLLLAGIVAIGVFYALTGIIMIVRYDRITDFLIPMAAVVSVLQLPFLYFWEMIVHPILLIVPTSAPAMIMRGAFVPLSGWEWAYAIAYSLALGVGLTIWAHRAFNYHIVQKVS